MESANDLVFFVGLGTAIIIMLALAIIAFFSFSQNRLRQEKLRTNELELDYQRQLLERTFTTQEAERARIAKDLHDDIGAKLNVIHLYLKRLAKKAPDAAPITADISAILTETVQTTRRIAHDLLPPTLEKFGLASAIEEQIDRLKDQPGPKIAFHYNEQGAIFTSSEAELQLFRVLQELLSNTLKYAEAQQVQIDLQQTNAHLSLSYQDDGKGFDPSATNNQKGLGMRGLKSRLDMIGAQWDLRSEAGKGMMLEVVVE